MATNSKAPRFLIAACLPKNAEKAEDLELGGSQLLEVIRVPGDEKCHVQKESIT